MLWIIFSVICAVYYAVVKYVAQNQQLTGIWLALAVLFFLLFFYYHYRDRHPRKKPIALWVRTFWITTLVLCLVMVSVVLGRIFADMWASPEEELSIIILLNQQDMPAETKKEWQARLDEAIEYLKAHESTRVIVSGGWDTTAGSSEAHTMYAYLQDHGVDGSRILWEIRSKNMKENLEYAMLIANGGKQPVGIVSSDYSMYRTLRIARNQGYLQAQPLAAPTTVWLYPHRMVQEILQVLWDKFMGV